MEQVDCVVIGAQTSSRNSEVSHAGMYYDTGSLKAQLCVRGNRLLCDYCAERGVAHQRCGRFIVATAVEQLAQLQSIHDRARANGVTDCSDWMSPRPRPRPPSRHCAAWRPSFPLTGIVDSHGLMLALLADTEHAGGILALNSPLALAKYTQCAIELVAVDGSQLAARLVVNAAGLQAPALATRFEGLDVQWVDRYDDTPVQPERGDAFYAEVRKYWPALPDGALAPAYAGIRPKISGPNEPACDFCIQGPRNHGIPGLVNLFDIESPGLTSCLAIGERVSEMLARSLGPRP